MSSQGPAGQTVVTEDVEIVGTIKAGGSIQINGKLSGDLLCSSDVVIGKTANIKGNVSASSATIEGQVLGNITAKDRIGLKAAARVTGDVKAKRLTVEDGVTFVGKAEVNPSGASAAPASEPEAEEEAPAETQASGEEASRGSNLFGKK